MGLGVGGVHELAGHEAVGDLLGQLVGLGNGALHALGALGQHQLRAVGLHQLAALHAHGLRHHDDDPVAPGGGHRGQADAGVAGGRLNDDAALLQQALGLGVIDHGLGDTVLDAAGGVKVLQLGQHPGLQAELLLDMGQLQQGGLTDQLVSGSVNVRHNDSPFRYHICCLFRWSAVRSGAENSCRRNIGDTYALSGVSWPALPFIS